MGRIGKKVLSWTLCLMMAAGMLPVATRGAKAVPALAAPSDSPYQLWVGGTPVTAVNADDIPAANPAERTGKAAYDPGSNTLTLTDYRRRKSPCTGNR